MVTATNLGHKSHAIDRWSEVSIAIAGCRIAEENFVGGFGTKACGGGDRPRLAEERKCRDVDHFLAYETSNLSLVKLDVYAVRDLDEKPASRPQ